jgi:hypothetical protein
MVPNAEQDYKTAQPAEQHFPTHSQDIGTQLIKSLQSFLSFIIAISIFGASIFASLVSQLATPTKFSLSTVRTFMAISFLLFLLLLGVAMVASILVDTDDMMVYFPIISAVYNLKDRPSRPQQVRKMRLSFSLLIVFICQVLLVGAVMFMSLIIVAYAETVGWVAVSIVAFSGILMLQSWVGIFGAIRKSGGNELNVSVL